METYIKVFQVNEKFDAVESIDLHGVIILANGVGLYGTISIETADGVRHFTGEHGFTDYVNDFGFIIEIEDTE
jgi:hypothetical protein